MNSTYYEAVTFCQRSTREDGIDAALTHNHNQQLSALLVPPDVGQTYQIAAQAGTCIFLPESPFPPPHLSLSLSLSQKEKKQKALRVIIITIKRLTTGTPFFQPPFQATR